MTARSQPFSFKTRSARRSFSAAFFSHSSTVVITAGGSLPRCSEMPVAITSISEAEKSASRMNSLALSAGRGVMTALLELS